MGAPKSDEVEISFFGPGFGECIVIHAGFNEWIVIDSCIDSATSRPAALAYLESIGVDPRSAVRFVLITHWHDDHVGGIAELVNACGAAEIAFSAALTRTEFLEVVATFNSRPLMLNACGLTEIGRVFSTLRSRKQPRKYALADRLLLRLAGAERPASSICELTALSPSDSEFERFLQSMSALMPKGNTTKSRLPSSQPNDISVATWLRVGQLQAVLGADLEEHGVPDRGWAGVVGSKQRPQARAGIFKIPHHGSQTGHYGPVWTVMLDDGPIVILTPWTLGAGSLPGESDCRRIFTLTPNAYVTSRPRPRRKGHDPAVAKTLREAGIVVTNIEPRTGSVRLRSSLNDPFEWQIELTAPAMKMDAYLAAIAAGRVV